MEGDSGILYSYGYFHLELSIKYQKIGSSNGKWPKAA